MNSYTTTIPVVSHIIINATIMGALYIPMDGEIPRTQKIENLGYVSEMPLIENGISYNTSETNLNSNISDFNLFEAMSQVAFDLVNNSHPAPPEFKNILDENWEDLLLV